MKDQLTKDIAELLILAPYPSISEYEPINKPVIIENLITFKLLFL